MLLCLFVFLVLGKGWGKGRSRRSVAREGRVPLLLVLLTVFALAYVDVAAKIALKGESTSSLPARGPMALSRVSRARGRFARVFDAVVNALLTTFRLLDGLYRVSSRLVL